MANKIRPKVAMAFNTFSRKLSRSTQLLDNADIDLCREDDLLQKKIDERDKDYRKAIVTAYSRFMNPFRVLGKTSREALEINEDEQNLLRAYNLFRAVKKADKEIGNASTFIQLEGIKSPLTEKMRYTTGGDLIYLQCWLIYEQGVRDYVPCLVEVEERLETYYRLEFVPTKSYDFNWQDREVIAEIEETFYHGRKK